MHITVEETWISNPFMMPFFYTANYYFGAWRIHIAKHHRERKECGKNNP